MACFTKRFTEFYVYEYMGCVSNSYLEDHAGMRRYGQNLFKFFLTKQLFGQQLLNFKTAYQSVGYLMHFKNFVALNYFLRNIQYFKFCFGDLFFLYLKE